MTTPTSFRGDEGATADELAAASPLAEMTAEQDAHAQQYAIEFLSKVIRIRGVAVSRQDYLRQELRKLGTSDAQIGIALESTPLNAGIALDRLDELAASTIDFETRKSAAMSFTAGLTGGFAMLATVLADITQYHVHALRIIQKLVYLYGWQDLLSDLDEADDETVGRLALFFGVMMGVGGVISGSMTLVALKSQSVRLLVHLREMPPPGADAAEYASILARADSIEQTPTIAELTRSADSGLKSAAAEASDVAAGAAESASGPWGASLAPHEPTRPGRSPDALQRRIRGLRGPLR